MMAKVDACREIAWHEKMKTDLGIADALECDVTMAREIVDALFRARSTAGLAPVERCHGTEAGIRLAIAHALHKVAGLGLTDAAAVSAGSRQVSASLTKLLEFRPRGLRPGEDDLPDGGCADPLMLFSAHAAEAIPIAAVDEYLDVADGRRVYWRKPGATPTRSPASSTVCHAQVGGKTRLRSGKSTWNCSRGCKSRRTTSANGSGPSPKVGSALLPTGSPSAPLG